MSTSQLWGTGGSGGREGPIAQIGAAEADLFPRFSLTGSFGLAGSKVGALTNAADRFWSVGPAVSWPVFDGGRIGAENAEGGGSRFTLTLPARGFVETVV